MISRTALKYNSNTKPHSATAQLDKRLVNSKTWRSQQTAILEQLLNRAILGECNSRTKHPMGEEANSTKLAILAREHITLGSLLETEPTKVKLPTEPIYEAPREDANEQTERERPIQNSPLKMH